jgi:hypothetical protein
MNDDLVTHLDSADEWLLDYPDEDEELPPDAVKRLHLCVGAVTARSSTQIIATSPARAAGKARISVTTAPGTTPATNAGRQRRPVRIPEDGHQQFAHCRHGRGCAGCHGEGERVLRGHPRVHGAGARQDTYVFWRRRRSASLPAPMSLSERRAGLNGRGTPVLGKLQPTEELSVDTTGFYRYSLCKFSVDT